MIEKPNLLLLEDNDKQIDLLMDTLSDDFEVTWVKNQSELEEKINAQFSVIVTDVSINESDKPGYQLIDDLRVNMRITRIPIVVYSANVNIEDIEKEQGKLFCGYVDKGNDVSGDVLLQTCIDCAKERQNVVSMTVWRASFAKLGKLYHPLDSDVVGELELLGIHDIKTIDDLCIQLDNDIEQSEWKILEDSLSNYWFEFNK